MGDSKPKNVEEYLKDFISEIKKISFSGITSGSQKYLFSLKYMICDAPRRAFLKKIKCHNGYHACERCNVRGYKINGRFIYPLSDTNVKRTNDTFRNQTHKEHHIGITPLLEIKNFDIVFEFPLDYMHMVCLGVMRRLLCLWFKSDSKYRLTPVFQKKLRRE